MASTHDFDPPLIRSYATLSERQVLGVKVWPRRTVLRRTIVIVVIGCVLGGFYRVSAFAADPLLHTYHAGSRVRQLQAELAAERDRHAALEEEVAYLGSNAGVEETARSYGWIYEDEVVLPLPRSARAEVETAQPDETRTLLIDRPATSDRIRSFVDTCLAVFGPR